MSDVETTEDDTVENPEPEADAVAEPSANLNAESDNNFDFVTENAVVDEASGFNVSGNDNSNNEPEAGDVEASVVSASICLPKNSDNLESDSLENVEPSVNENPEGFQVPNGDSAAGGQEINDRDTNRSHNDSMTEGDQNLFKEHNRAAQSVEVQNNDNENADSRASFGCYNEYAAEDEQYFQISSNGEGCGVSFEPEGSFAPGNRPNITVEEDCTEGAGAEEGMSRECITSHRTESSCQLEDYNYQEYAAGSHVDYNSNNQSRNTGENMEPEGASASGQDEFLGPESELEEVQSGLTLEKEKEPTESDQEIQLDDLVNVSANRNRDINGSSIDVVAQANLGADAIIISSNGDLNTLEVNGVESCAEKSFPEDELGGISLPKSNSCTESYQPECDQSETDQTVSLSSQVVQGTGSDNHNAVGDTNLQAVHDFNSCENVLISKEEKSKLNADTDSCETLNPKTCDTKFDKGDASSRERPKMENQEHGINTNESCAIFSKETGAIPKHRKKIESKVSETNSKTNDSEKSVKPAFDADAGIKEDIDLEEELLSELDATLKHTTTESSYSVDSAISSDEQRHELVSCDQCLKNKLECSFKANKHASGNHANIPSLKDLKRQLHQAKQILLDRECEISRLKEDLSDHRLRCEALTTERDANQKEIQRLKSHNSDDLYIPQLKELEYTIAQQTNEIRGLKDKLSSHDAAAKRAIATLQQEMRLRVEQVQRQADEANREKDTMVVKYAQAEHKNLEFQKQAERAENKLKDMEKERDAFLVKMRAVKDQRSKLAADVEAKNVEISNIQRDLEKHREMVASADIRVKWAQNKLKAELEGHKDTKVQLEKMTAKLKEAKEETQMIRQDCQAIIKTYQESEEVKSNSLDKELKQKESELLQREVQKNNFELAHVKTQRELEQLKGEFHESQTKFSALSEKLSSVEAEKEQSILTATKYADIIQKQKKEIQELREKVESLVQFKTDFTSAQELIKNLDSDIADLKMTNKELVADMEACRRRETENLELTSKLSRKNAELQSENTTLSNKVLNLTGELQALKMENQDSETKLKDLADSLANEKKLHQEESQSLNMKLAGKCKAVEDLTRKLDDEKDEIKTLKRKHTNNIKDLTRQLQQVRRKLENYEVSSNGDKDTISIGSRTSSNGSLNTVGIAEQTNTQVVQPNYAAHHNSVQRHPSPEQEYPVITEQIEVDKQTLIERIVKLQKALARKNEKIEFMEDHISQLVDEIQKKNKIIQSYFMKEEGGIMTSEFRDRAKPALGALAKMEISRKHSIMGSVYSSHSNDGTMTLDLSLEINRKLQAVLEDTILKNMTLKESLDTLGQEIARLSQENRQLQLNIQGKSKSSSKSNMAKR